MLKIGHLNLKGLPFWSNCWIEYIITKKIVFYIAFFICLLYMGSVITWNTLYGTNWLECSKDTEFWWKFMTQFTKLLRIIWNIWISPWFGFKKNYFWIFTDFFTQWNQIFVCCLFHQNKPLILIAYKFCEKLGMFFPFSWNHIIFWILNRVVKKRRFLKLNDICIIRFMVNLLWLKWSKFAENLFTNIVLGVQLLLKFIYSEKARIFCEIFS